MMACYLQRPASAQVAVLPLPLLGNAEPGSGDVSVARELVVVRSKSDIAAQQPGIVAPAITDIGGRSLVDRVARSSC